MRGPVAPCSTCLRLRLRLRRRQVAARQGHRRAAVTPRRPALRRCRAAATWRPRFAGFTPPLRSAVKPYRVARWAARRAPFAARHNSPRFAAGCADRTRAVAATPPRPSAHGATPRLAVGGARHSHGAPSRTGSLRAPAALGACAGRRAKKRGRGGCAAPPPRFAAKAGAMPPALIDGAISAPPAVGRSPPPGPPGPAR